MVIKCPVCGEENADDATICKVCGAPLEKPSEKKAKSGKILLAIFIFAILVVVAIVVAPIIYKSVPSHNKTDDSDKDGMPDEWELANGLNPNDPGDRNSDADNDGLNNLGEYQKGTDPQNPDTDGDGIPDGPDLIPKADAGIRVAINSLRINDFVIFKKPTAKVFSKIYIGDELVGEIPSEPAELKIDKDYDVNWSMVYNVQDDRSLYKVRIELYSMGLWGKEMLDINGDSPSKPPKDPSGYYLEINYYMGKDNVGRFQSDISDGSNDGNIGIHDDKDAKIEYTITTIDMSAL